MNIQIPLIPTTAPSPIDLASYIEVAVPDGASATGFTTCKILLSSLGLAPGKSYKANLKQSGTSAPTVTELVNTTALTPTLSRPGVGSYKLAFTSLFTNSAKLIIHGFANGEDGKTTLIPVLSAGSIVGYYTLYYSSSTDLLLKCYDNSFAAADISTILGANNNLPIEFTVFP